MLEKAAQSVDSDPEKLPWSLRTSASRPRLWNEVGGSPFRPASQFSSFKAALAHGRSGCSCSVAMKNSGKRLEARGGAPFHIPLQGEHPSASRCRGRTLTHPVAGRSTPTHPIAGEHPSTSCCWEEHPYASRCRGSTLMHPIAGGSTLTHPIAGCRNHS